MAMDNETAMGPRLMPRMRETVESAALMGRMGEVTRSGSVGQASRVRRLDSQRGHPLKMKVLGRRSREQRSTMSG